MTLLRLLILRSLRSRPLRTLLSGFGIVLGVATILAISITNQTALESVTRLFKDTSGKANLVITSADAEAGGFSESVLQRLRAVPGLAGVVPTVHVQTILAEEAGQAEIGLNFFGASAGGLTLYGIDPTLDPQAREYKLVAGEFLSPQGEGDQILLVKTFADENDIQLGKAVAIITDSGVEKLRVVGLMAKEGPGQLNNGSFGVIPLETAQKLFYRNNELDQVDLIATPENTSTEALGSLRTSLQATLGDEYTVTYPASQGQRMTQMLGSYQIGLNFLSGMALFVGAFLIFNAFSMTVVERTREFGMLRTVGMTRSQVTRQVLLEAATLGLLGSILGVGLGILLARGLTSLMEVMLSQDLSSIAIPQGVVVSSMLVGILVALVSASIPALQAGRISPLEALRVRGVGKEGWLIRKGWIPGAALLVFSAVILVINPFPYDVQFRMGSMVVFSLFLGGTLMIPASVNVWERTLRPVIRLFYGNSGRLGSSNIQRAKLRTTLTAAALMIGVSMIIVVWVMTDSFKGDLDKWLEGYIGGDLYVASSLPMGRDVWRRLEAVEGVAAAAPVRYFDVERRTPAGEKEKLAYMGIDPASHSQVTTFIFSQPNTDAFSALQQLADGDSVFISSVIAEKSGLKAGDSITLLTKTGEKPFKVAAVVVDYYNQGLVVTGSWVDMARYFRQKDANAFLIKVLPGFDIDQVGQRIDDLYGKRDQLIVESNEALLQRVSGLMQNAFSMFDVLALIAMLVGFMGIMNTLTMNVMERTQEIGMLRGVGMTRLQVLVMILAEAVQIGLLGGVLGLAFGVILSRILMAAMTAMSGYTLAYVLPWDRVLLAILMAVVISQLAALLPALKAARTRILEAIQYE